ncbi:glycosyltransferase [Gramella sp. GC03-9]|uniref:Glycosyltransferase n=1 Tax=Christiangramia oceanisediminis TaxID=2920386 RepID=A0A9X2IAG7_9FLAO|nr:glycosyltransferase [Gramella oceanisediminis]MCP9199898.1 glycosyltransferase [Gramella oceanisediminis]
MKILQLVTKRQYRGAEVFAANLSMELIALGHTIIFAGLYKNESNILEVQDARNVDLSNKKHNNFSFSLLRSLIDLIKNEDPDVIQCNGSDTLKYMIAARFMVKKKPILYRNISTISEWLDSDIKLTLYKKIFSKVDHVTSVGSESIQDLITTLEYPEEQTSVIRRGIPNKKIEGSKFYDKIRKELGLDKDAKIVMHVGNFSPEKNHILLLEIFEDLKKDHPEIKLVCVGDGVTFKNIQEEIHNRNLKDAVYLLGFRKDIPELLSASDCIVLSSLVEGVPGVILEAAVQGKPSVASNVGGVKEVLIDGETGFIIDNFDKRDFSEKLARICMDPQLRQQLGENARHLVIDQFNPVKNAKKFENLYARLAGIQVKIDKKKDSLRILQIIQKKQYRGAEIFCCQLGNELERKGHVVKIYSIYDGNAKLPFIKPIESLERKQVLRYTDFYGWKAIAEIINDFKPDIVQANASDTLKYTVLSKELFGWSTPIIFRNASVTSYYVTGKLSKKLNHFLFQKVNYIVSVSESSKRDLNKLFPFTNQKTEVISNGVDINLDVDSENPYKSCGPNIVHVGSLTIEKNHLELLYIFKMFLNKNPGAKLHIIGEGDLKEEIETEVNRLKLDKDVVLYGEMRHPEAYIKYATMLVLPSLIEGLPGVILEAMKLRTIVVAYDVGGISEVLNNNTGFLVKPNNLESFVKSMEVALKENQSSKISEAKKLVSTKFNNSVLAENFLQVYKKTILKRNEK